MNSSAADAYASPRGSLVILHAGEWHRYRPNARTGWREAYVGFAGDFCKKILAAPFFPPPPTVLDIPTGGRFEQDLLTLIDKVHAESTTAPYSLAGDFMSLLGSVIEQTSTLRGEHAHNGAIRAIQLHIGHHLAETLDFVAIARQHGLSYALFRKAFRSSTRGSHLSNTSLRCASVAQRVSSNRRTARLQTSPATSGFDPLGISRATSARRRGFPLPNAVRPSAT